MNDSNDQLLAAARDGDNDSIEALIGQVNVNYADITGFTALHYATWRGHVSTMELIIRSGGRLNVKDDTGRTAMHIASNSGDISAINLLLREGADAHISDRNGRTSIDLSSIQVAREIRERMLRFSLSLKVPIKRIGQTIITDPSLSIFNLSLDSWDDELRMGMFFRYGPGTVVSIFHEAGVMRMSPPVRGVAPICAGEGRVIYSRGGRVYENGIDFRGPEHELCFGLSSGYEKNWGCFKRSTEDNRQGDYFIVYSVVPLRIFQVTNHTNCHEVPALQHRSANNYPTMNSVRHNYPNLEEIERLFIETRDARNTGIFRGATRGIEFGKEHLFVGHVTLRDQRCFPNSFAQRTHVDPNRERYPRMYFMFFYTIKFTNDTFSISRMSSCFQPPSPDGLHKIVFPAGIAKRFVPYYFSESIVVSYGQNDDDCRVVSYSVDDVNALLAPVDSWHRNNYVFHPNYAEAIRDSKVRGNSLYTRLSGKRMGLLGTSPETDGLFNPAITNDEGGNFVTAWRHFDGDVTRWQGYNYVAMESCSLKVKDGILIYSTVDDPVQFKVGTTTIGGEDPRLIFENDCPLLLINDLDLMNRQPGSTPSRKMYVHNLKTDENAITVHPFCHNLSTSFEKNWGPFYVEKELHFVYSVDPLVVAKVRTEFKCPTSTESEDILCDKLEPTPTPSNLKDIFDKNGVKMRGGTPGIKLSSNEYLFVGHAVQDNGMPCFSDYVVQRFINRGDDAYAKRYPKLYTAFFYTIVEDSGSFRLNRISCCSHFPGGRESFSKIVFPAGLAKANLGGIFRDAFVVSFGVKDTHGVFCAVNREFLEYVLRPVDYWNTQNYVVDVNYFQNVLDLGPTWRRSTS